MRRCRLISREHLRGMLPDYMVPSTVVALDAFPLTANGKVDERALAAIEPAPRRAGAQSDRGATEAERVVASVWREVLGVDDVGLHDNFFDLGGHSLLVPQVHRRLEQRFDGAADDRRSLPLPDRDRAGGTSRRSGPAARYAGRERQARGLRRAHRARRAAPQKSSAPRRGLGDRRGA